jgi:hypothetical protein
MPESLLKRIIAASSNPGDCVLDPFCGSGTTAAAAIAMGRNFVMMDISPNYVRRAGARLDELREKRRRCGAFNLRESEELTRLVSDIDMPPKAIAADAKLIRLFQKLLALRTGNGRKYPRKELADALNGLKGVRIP